MFGSNVMKCRGHITTTEYIIIVTVIIRSMFLLFVKHGVVSVSKHDGDFSGWRRISWSTSLTAQQRPPAHHPTVAVPVGRSLSRNRQTTVRDVTYLIAVVQRTLEPPDPDERNPLQLSPLFGQSQAKCPTSLHL